MLFRFNFKYQYSFKYQFPQNIKHHNYFLYIDNIGKIDNVFAIT